MKIALNPRGSADLLVLPFWEKGKAACHLDAAWKEKLRLPLADFKAKLSDTLLHYWEGELEPRVLLLGLGPEAAVTAESIRRAYAAAIAAAKARKVKSVNFLFPETPLPREAALRGFYEGICLTNYAFVKLKHDSIQETPPSLVESVCLIGLQESDRPHLQKWETILESVRLVRDLVNMNADDKAPAALAEAIRAFAPKLKIHDEKAIGAEGMGLLLAVSRGSSHEPRLLEWSYRGDPDSKEHIVLVGKGITYDTGGLSLKPTDGMLTMKSDMAGAVTVMAAVRAAAALQLKVNVTALAPCAENCIDAKSYKLGDVYRSHSGKTVEINNTDGEGRLVLADAMSYAVKHLHPTCMVDVATLTGGIIVALGDDISGLFTPDDKLAEELMAASRKTDELLWRMPMNKDYKEALKSDVADLINTSGREGGAIKAAFFLQEFVGATPWAHIDFAGPAYRTKPKHYNPSAATGYGVRLLVEFLEGKAR